MRGRHQTVGGGGRRKSSAAGQIEGLGDHALRAGGRTARACVLKTYTPSESEAFNDTDSDIEDRAVTSYCDVIVYGSSEGLRFQPLRRVPVMLSAGLHNGHICTLRPSTIDIEEEREAPYGGENMLLANLSGLDGDHVLIEFLEDDLMQPIITQRIPHPYMGFGNDELDIGHRMRPKDEDGLVDFWKHQGTFHGVDSKGNYTIDTTRAHDGKYALDGKEQPKDDSAYGNVTVIANAKSKVTVKGLDSDGSNPTFEVIVEDNKLEIKLQNGASLLLENNEGDTTLKVGDGDHHVAIVEHLQDLYGDLKNEYDNHFHPDTALKAVLTALSTDMATIAGIIGAGTGTVTAIGVYQGLAPPANPEPPATPAPPWDLTINSDKVSIPDN